MASSRPAEPPSQGYRTVDRVPDRFPELLARLTTRGAFAGKRMLLTTLKFVALIWLGVLVTGIVVLPALYMFGLAARAIGRSLARRR
jgi:hypothetical protein